MRQAMAENGSPPPKFSTDEGRTYFLVELPVHPQMPGGGQAHDEAKRAPARDDRGLVDWVRGGLVQRDDGMARLVIGGHALLVLGHDH